MYFLFGCLGLLWLLVMLLPTIDASPYISFIIGWEASLAGRSTITHDGVWIRLHKRRQAVVAAKNQF